MYRAFERSDREVREAQRWWGVNGMWEFVRIGEEVEDVEQRRSYNADPLLYLSRSIECDY
jgi:hypothetical protein